MKKINLLTAISFLLNNNEAVIQEDHGSRLSFTNIPGTQHVVLCWNNDPDQIFRVSNDASKEYKYSVASLGGETTSFCSAFCAYKSGHAIFSKVSGAFYYDYEETDKDRFHHADISGLWEVLPADYRIR